MKQVTLSAADYLCVMTSLRASVNKWSQEEREAIAAGNERMARLAKATAYGYADILKKFNENAVEV